MQKTLWKRTFKLWLFTLFNIPLVAWLYPRVLVASETSCTVMIPFCRRSKNHVRSMYFGALCTGADLAPGLLTMNILENLKAKCSFVFKDFQAEFLKRCEGDVHFVCNQGDLITAAIKAAVATKERQNIPLDVTATVPSITGDEAVAKFKLTISIKARA